MTRKHTTIAVQFHWGLLWWRFLFCSFLVLCQLILNMMVASPDGLYLMFTQDSKLSLLNVELRSHPRWSAVGVSFLHVLCFCWHCTTLHQSFYCPVTQDHELFRQCFVARFSFTMLNNLHRLQNFSSHYSSFLPGYLWIHLNTVKLVLQQPQF